MMKPERCIEASHPKWFGLALQALVILSKESIQTCPSVELAAYLRSEPTLLRRILSKLVRGGILQTREGRDGGYRLNLQPESITLAAVYQALQVKDPLCSGIRDTIGDHPYGLEMQGAFTCITDEMDRAQMDILEKYTIADLAGQVACPREFS